MFKRLFAALSSWHRGAIDREHLLPGGKEGKTTMWIVSFSSRMAILFSAKIRFQNPTSFPFLPPPTFCSAKIPPDNFHNYKSAFNKTSYIGQKIVDTVVIYSIIVIKDSSLQQSQAKTGQFLRTGNQVSYAAFASLLYMAQSHAPWPGQCRRAECLHILWG